MGYENVTHYKLKFEDRPGLEVTVEELAIGELLDVMEMSSKIPDKAGGQLDPESAKTFRSLMETLAANLVEWNVERRGVPLPADLRCGAGLVMDIIQAWVAAQNGPDADLGKDSGSGATSDLEQSLPVEPRSPSHPS